jgi:hypothetical protein
MSAVRVVDELLEPGGVFGDEPGKPRGVDEAEGKKIAQVSAVFVAEGVELHPHPLPPGRKTTGNVLATSPSLLCRGGEVNVGLLGD